MRGALLRRGAAIQTWMIMVICVVSGCARGPDAAPPIVVLGASSLRGLLSDAAESWRVRTGAVVQVRVDSSSRLARQLEQGAAADLFVTADPEWLQRVPCEGCRRVVLGGNRLVIAVREGLSIGEPEELRDPHFVRVATAAESVPLGRYARQALAALSLTDALSPRLVNAPNAASAEALLRTGAVDGAVLYRSDVRDHPATRVVVLPSSTHDPIRYEALLLRPRAAALVDWLASAEARALWGRHGLVAPGEE